jgi:hypothetical protein
MNGTQRRDPDSMEPSNAFFAALVQIHRFGSMLTSTQGLFSLKACVLTVLVATPAWTPQTVSWLCQASLLALALRSLTLVIHSQAEFAYKNRRCASNFLASAPTRLLD